MACLNGVLLSPPRMTGDGYYEAMIAYPDQNRVGLMEALLKTSCRS
ncbi:hypothetical protein GOO34_001597 [Salmonella enterica]|nr:hypothetical protein [Salmonella enterica]